MNKNIIIIGILSILTGCVSTKTIPMQENAIDINKTHRVIISQREKPDFAAGTAGNARFDFLFFPVTISKGNDIVQENEIEDPSFHISGEILKALATKYKFEIVSGNSSLVQDEDAEDLAGLYSGSDFIMDVRTIYWGFGYFPMDWDNYRVLYSAKLRIIDTAKKSVVAEGFCARVPDQDEKSPTYDQLMANSAERLKEELRIAADYCIEYFKTNTLKL